MILYDKNGTEYDVNPTYAHKRERVIDLSPLVGTGILCEFWDSEPCGNNICYLGDIDKSIITPFKKSEGARRKHCRPLYNQPFHVEQLNGNPLPEGFEVEWLHINIHTEKETWVRIGWEKVSCVTAPIFRITGTKDGWRLP